jgi:phosphate transport system permease protein
MSDKTKLSKVKKRIAKDKIVFGLVCFFSFLSMIPLFLIIWNVVSKGYKNFNWRLFTEVAPSSMDALIAKMSGEPIPGGILNGITGRKELLSCSIF